MKVQNEVEVVSVDACLGQTPAVITSAGARIEGDVLVGADGRFSIVRKFLEENSSESEGEENEEDSDDDSEGSLASSTPAHVVLNEISGCAFLISLHIN